MSEEKKASEQVANQYKAETGKDWMTNPVCHGELGFASWDYQLWLEAKVSALQTQIQNYKTVCLLADVPQLIIEHPSFIKPQPLTEEDVQWARAEFKKYNEWKNSPF